MCLLTVIVAIALHCVINTLIIFLLFPSDSQLLSASVQQLLGQSHSQLFTTQKTLSLSFKYFPSCNSTSLRSNNLFFYKLFSIVRTVFYSPTYSCRRVEIRWLQKVNWTARRSFSLFFAVDSCNDTFCDSFPTFFNFHCRLCASLFTRSLFMEKWKMRKWKPM